MDVASEILDAIEIIVDKKVRENTAQIYLGICKSVSGNTCVMLINGKDNTVQFYGSTPTVGSIYRVFVPNGNMSMAFVITGANGGSGGSSGVTSYTKLTELPTINGVVLQEGDTSKSLSLYGIGNEPNYPVTKVNGKTGEVTLTADDVGALPLNTDIPKKTSELTNDSGFITLAQVPDSPVQSVNGKTGDIILTATDVNALPSSTTIPTKTSQLTNDSGFITLAQVPEAPVQSVNGQTGKVVIDEYSLPTASDTVLGGIKIGSGLTMNSDGVLSATGGGVADAVEWANVQSKPTTISGYGITDAKIDNGVVILGDNRITPVTSVNGQTGDVNISTDLPDNLVKYDAMGEVESTQTIDATTLQGHNANYFATAADVSNLQTEQENINTSLANKVSLPVVQISDTHAFTDIGWYWVKAYADNMPMDMGGVDYNSIPAIMFVRFTNGSFAEIDLWFPSWSSSFIPHFRQKYVYGTWEPWCWVDPPMYLGVEYRTTERYQGKPVYVMTKDYGLVQEKNTPKYENIPENAGYGWVVNGLVTYYGIPIPSWNDDGSLRFGVQYEYGSGKIRFIANEDRVNIYAKYIITIKYIKTTD